MKDEQHDENFENIVGRLGESVEMIIVLEMKRMNVVEHGGCAWMAPNEPLAPPSVVAAVAMSIVIGGCGSPPSISSFATLEQQFVYL